MDGWQPGTTISVEKWGVELQTLAVKWCVNLFLTS